MKFVKYQHIERLEKRSVKGILNGNVFVFPKIDGTNASIWLNEDNEICGGSRNRKLTLKEDNQGFYKFIKDNEDLYKNLLEYLISEVEQDIIIYGEWLVPHTLKTYRTNAWRNFYIFDICIHYNGNKKYINYKKYRKMIEEYNNTIDGENKIEYIPAIAEIENPDKEKLYDIMKRNKYLIQDGKGTGEGVVLKNYSYTNPFGKIKWAKLVENKFADKHNKNNIKKVKNKKKIEEKIVEKYLRPDEVQKEYAKTINNHNTEWDKKYIRELLGRIWHAFIEDEIYTIIKKEHDPTINFHKLRKEIEKKIKELKPKLFK